MRIANVKCQDGFGKLAGARCVPANVAMNELFCSAAHLEEHEDFAHAPQPVQVAASMEDKHPFASGQVDRQAREVSRYFRLVDAKFVDPQLRLSFVRSGKLFTPCLQHGPLLHRFVVPTVAQEIIYTQKSSDL